LARKNEKLMPRDPVGEAETVQWMIAALNTIEMVTVPCWFLEVSGEEDNGLADWMGNRLVVACSYPRDSYRIAVMRTPVSGLASHK
jgi:hypothetical protein